MSAEAEQAKTFGEQEQQKLNELRRKELLGTLSETERNELMGLMARLEAEEAQLLAPYLERMRVQAAERGHRLETLRAENDELSRLLSQQQRLATDTKRFLAEFDERRDAISGALERLLKNPAPAA